eukprot:1908203-Rhodomonas_salina.2
MPRSETPAPGRTYAWRQYQVLSNRAGTALSEELVVQRLLHSDLEPPYARLVLDITQYNHPV